MFLSADYERVEDERQTFVPVEIAPVQSVLVSDVEVRMRADGVAGISEQGDDLTLADFIPDFNADAARLQVSA